MTGDAIMEQPVNIVETISEILDGTNDGTGIGMLPDSWDKVFSDSDHQSLTIKYNKLKRRMADVKNEMASIRLIIADESVATPAEADRELAQLEEMVMKLDEEATAILRERGLHTLRIIAVLGVEASRISAEPVAA
jgi:hypothetical protein